MYVYVIVIFRVVVCDTKNAITIVVSGRKTTKMKIEMEEAESLIKIEPIKIEPKLKLNQLKSNRNRESGLDLVIPNIPNGCHF